MLRHYVHDVDRVCTTDSIVVVVDGGQLNVETRGKKMHDSKTFAKKISSKSQNMGNFILNVLVVFLAHQYLQGLIFFYQPNYIVVGTSVGET